jgi:excisionase family DNA binding protein
MSDETSNAEWSNIAGRTHCTPIAPLLVDVHEAARLLSCSERTLWGLTAPRGQIPSVRLGRAVRYAVADLEAFVRESRKGCGQ